MSLAERALAASVNVLAQHRVAIAKRLEDDNADVRHDALEALVAERNRRTFGLMWTKTTNGWYYDSGERPRDGEELTNEALSEALLHERKQRKPSAAGTRTTREFTQEEWDAFGVHNLREDHYILSGGE